MSRKLDMDLVRQLREKTSAGIMDCKAALAESDNNVDKAIELLRKKGAEMATKKSQRTTNQGHIEAYIHHGGKIGVLVEVGCETDFVAKNEDFRCFAKDLAMQIAASSPKYVSREEVPAAALEAEREILKEQMKGKPVQAVEKAMPGKMEKFYQQICLLEQPFIRDPKIFIKDILASLVGKIGENIIIKRFARFQVGVE